MRVHCEYQLPGSDLPPEPQTRFAEVLSFANAALHKADKRIFNTVDDVLKEEGGHR